MKEIVGFVEDLNLTGQVRELIKGMSKTAFNARRLGEALEILEKIQSECELKILALAGAAVPAGLRGLLCNAVIRRLFNIIVTTGANVTHDLLEAFGGRHYRVNDVVCNIDEEVSLKKRGLCRIYNVVVKVKDFEIMEKGLRNILSEMEDRTYSTYEFLKEIGFRIEDERSLVRTAAKHDCKVIVPAFYDSILGVQVWSMTQTRKLRVMENLDLSYLVGLQFDAKRRNSKTGLMIVGGGTPKNFALQSALVADKPFDYVVQITIDPPYYGGLSGATLSEAVTWNKVIEKADFCTVYCDFTIALPLLLCALIC
ncbi:MAG: deoxyhypusine synthase family protein [Candidatus Nezhaarchaeota archaeon]|nr:deoxyhypusine synthase family protein [Candidatus Nezhaarchaeota archaeon]MCX8141832.1 deoxyhypusine synthase family protein [Candidatus Nezhaarchaeota archaeon]MDW8050387.1 deoxyhypusine synthase family protein [Nitrososphaerota archaeon]